MIPYSYLASAIVKNFDIRRTLLALALLASASPVHASPACQVLMDHVSIVDVSRLPSRQAQPLRATIDFIGSTLPLSPFKAKEVSSEKGSSANLWKRKLKLESTSSPGVVSHELGHLLFFDVIRTFAPNTYAELRTEKENTKKSSAYSATSLDSLVNSYAEPFCDLVALLTTGKTTIFAGTPWEFLNADRDWKTPPSYPWDKQNGASEYPRTRVNEYRRLGEFRRYLWTNHREDLLGDLNTRRNILSVVARAMAEEIDATHASPLTDYQRNRQLIQKISALLAK